MFQIKNTSETYWNSYKLLESQLIKLSHSICFDDEQINVYSSEVADIINSACIKIESLAKDIYEEHIFPFQIDNGIVPKSFLNGQKKKDASKFDSEKWTRNNWKYDYNCLVEIDEKYAISKKRVRLKFERFNFLKYGSTILPFYNISLNNCMGGRWEYSDGDVWETYPTKSMDVNWCKSYQDIKHNYIQSIPQNGTVKNAIMVLAAFYLLAVYNSCLPSKHFEWDNKFSNYELDFGSDLFACEMCNYTTPPFIINSEQIKLDEILFEEHKKEKLQNDRDYEYIDILNDINGLPFLVVLNEDNYKKVKSLVETYCTLHNLKNFDIAPYLRENGLHDDGLALYLNLQKYIKAPYRPNNICIAFNTGTNTVYNDCFGKSLEYEQSKYKNKNQEVLSALKIGDFVDAKFIFDVEVLNGEVIKINEHSIELSLKIDGIAHILSEPIMNIIYIKNVRKSK